MNDDPRLKELHDLIVAQLTAELTEAQQVHLALLLDSDAFIRRAYFEYLHDTHMLRRVLSAVDSPLGTRPKDAEFDDAEFRNSAREKNVGAKIGRVLRNFSYVQQISLAAVAVVGILTAVAYFASSLPRGTVRRLDEPVITSADGIVAEVAGVYAVEWQVGQSQRQRGAQLQAGERLQLQDGLVEVAFRSGAIVTLSGPCDFTVANRNGGGLQQGMLTAKVNEASRGFSISTPSTKIVDLGTEFGVEVAADGTSTVEVFQGKVQLESVGGRRTHELTAGNRVTTVIDGRIVTVTGGSRPAFARGLPVFSNILPASDVGEFHSEDIAYMVAAGVAGSQDFGGSLGLDFQVLKPIEVTRLGVFDSLGDGLNRPLVAELWRRDDAGTPNDPRDDRGAARIASLEFNLGQAGKLNGSNRFERLTQPLVLQPGAYTIVAHGYGPGEFASNEGPDPKSGYFKRGNDGHGALAFVGASRYGTAGEFPTTVDGLGNPRQYSAGTFAFRVLGNESN